MKLQSFITSVVFICKELEIARTALQSQLHWAWVVSEAAKAVCFFDDHFYRLLTREFGEEKCAQIKQKLVSVIKQKHSRGEPHIYAVVLLEEDIVLSAIAAAFPQLKP